VVIEEDEEEGVDTENVVPVGKVSEFQIL